MVKISKDVLCSFLLFSWFSLFISCNCVIVCSETSVCRSKMHSLKNNYRILFLRAITTLLQYSNTDSLAAEFQLLVGSIVKAVSCTTNTQHLRTTKLLYEKTRLSLVMSFLCLSQHFHGKNRAASAVKNFVYSIGRSFSHYAFFSGRIQSSSSFLARARKSESMSLSNSSDWFTSQILVKKLYYSSNSRSFAYSRVKKPIMIGFFVFNLCSDEFNFKFCIIQLI